jgi:hypothetical protein
MLWILELVDWSTGAGGEAAFHFSGIGQGPQFALSGVFEALAVGIGKGCFTSDHCGAQTPHRAGGFEAKF